MKKLACVGEAQRDKSNLPSYSNDNSCFKLVLPDGRTDLKRIFLSEPPCLSDLCGEFLTILTSPKFLVVFGGKTKIKLLIKQNQKRFQSHNLFYDLSFRGRARRPRQAVFLFLINILFSGSAKGFAPPFFIYLHPAGPHPQPPALDAATNA